MPSARDSQPPIHVDGVSKQFATTTALDDISLDVMPGEIFGLVGPNGAGKTTLIRTILDIIKPDRGSIRIFGHVFAAADRDRIGYLPEERGLYTRQTVGAVLEYLGMLKGLTPGGARAAAGRWLARVGLGEASARRVDQLSKGNQQKVQVAATLMAEPAIAILDEPLSGLDPVSARVISGEIKLYAAAGHTVVLSTHQMNLVESLCARVFMIAHGRRVLYGDVKAIKREHSTHSVRVRSIADYAKCPLVTSAVPGTTEDEPSVVNLHDTATLDSFLGWLVGQDARVDHFERLSMPLEEIFVRVAGRAGAAA